MSLTVVPAASLIHRLAEFDTIIDARSEAEFDEDRLPGAVNWPTLNNAERILIGTTYKQVNAFEAKKRGAALAARNIAAHIERHCLGKPKDWKPLAYCWRGGKRSGSLSLILDQIGFKVTLVEGGYKAFRAAIVQDIVRLASLFNFRVICGPTGSGKTRLLQTLGKAGAQILDLEALAEHRSSVLGLIPGQPQPSQKQFDMRVWDALRKLDPSQPVYVESESKKVGNVSVHYALMDAIRSGQCLLLDLPLPERVLLLLEDYDFFVKDGEYFCERLDVLKDLRGKSVIDAWKAQVRGKDAAQLAQVVRELLELHYDPGYASSTRRNYKNFGTHKLIVAPGRGDLNDLGFARRVLGRQG